MNFVFIIVNNVMYSKVPNDRLRKRYDCFASSDKRLILDEEIQNDMENVMQLEKTKLNRFLRRFSKGLYAIHDHAHHNPQ